MQKRNQALKGGPERNQVETFDQVIVKDRNGSITMIAS